MLVSDGGERRMIHASTWWVSVASAPWEDQSQGLQLSPTLASVWRMVISRSCRMMSLSLSLSLSLKIFSNSWELASEEDDVGSGVVELGEVVREGGGGVVDVED